MSHRERESGALLPVIMVGFALVAVAAIVIRVCYEILVRLSRIGERFCK